MPVRINIEMDAELRDNKIVVDGEVSAKLRQRIPLNGTVTIASVTQEFDEEFDLAQGDGKSKRKFGPLEIEFTYNSKEVCAAGKISVGGRSKGFSGVCVPL